MSKNPIKKIRITYTKANDYKVIFSDNALVGQSAGKAITLDFYSGNFVPLEEIHTIKEDQTADIAIKDVDIHPYERILQIEIVLTPENAYALINTIKQRLELMGIKSE